MFFGVAPQYNQIGKRGEGQKIKTTETLVQWSANDQSKSQFSVLGSDLWEHSSGVKEQEGPF